MMPRRTNIRILCALLVCGLLLPLGGCGRASYGSITPHMEQRLDLSEPGDMTVSSYSALLTAVLHLVEQGAEEGVIRMADYPGDAQSDVLSACRQVQTSEPLGVYLVEYMSYECTRVLTYYEAKISITYRRSPEQIASIVEISTSTAFREAVATALDRGEDSIVANVRYYYPEQYDAAVLTEELLLAAPDRYVATPEVTTQVYPDGPGGWARILDITFDWDLSPATLISRREELSATAERLAAACTGEEQERAAALVAAAAEQIAPTGDLTSTLSDTSYGALVLRSATSRGAACGFAALCEAAGFEWRILPGVLAGDLHYWNMIKVGEDWYHVDITSAEPACLTAEELPEGYSWETLRFPTANGPSLLKQPEPEEETPPEGEVSPVEGEVMPLEGEDAPPVGEDAPESEAEPLAGEELPVEGEEPGSDEEQPAGED